MLKDKRVLLIVAGGIAAYKALELVRRLQDQGARVRGILTAGGANFITPLALAALTGDKVHENLFSLTEESEMGHIRLARDCDLVAVVPATAHLMAKMAAGMADDLAATVLLATDKPILLAPAMNVAMWNHPATQANRALLDKRGVRFVGPGAGDLACGEVGSGRLAEVPEILAAIAALLTPEQPLQGLRALVTSGPTREPIDPVRFIANHSSGKQGHAIARALAGLGAEVTLVTGPVALDDPEGVRVVRIETAQQMLAACQQALPAEVAVCAAAVADWRVKKPGAQKIKKAKGAPPPSLELVANPDILATLAASGAKRPGLVIGFAAETENLVAHAKAKRQAKGCDWILANDVGPETGTFGGDANTIHLVDASGVETWPAMSKNEVADRLAKRIALALIARPPQPSNGKRKANGKRKGR